MRPYCMPGRNCHADKRTDLESAVPETRAGHRGNNRTRHRAERPVARRCAPCRLGAVRRLFAVCRGRSLPALLGSPQSRRVPRRHRAIRVEGAGPAHHHRRDRGGLAGPAAGSASRRGDDLRSRRPRGSDLARGRGDGFLDFGADRIAAVLFARVRPAAPGNPARRSGQVLRGGHRAASGAAGGHGNRAMGAVAAGDRDSRRERELERRAAGSVAARVAGARFRAANGLLGHRFALRAKPPPELASALDVRGELRGSDLGDLLAWTGQVYAELEYTDLVAWRRWVDYPLEIRSGIGGVRLWLSIDADGLAEATADVALSQVVTRVAKDLPLLELEYLQGRLGAKRIATDNAFEVSGRRIALKTSAGVETGAGVVLPPADFRVRWQAGDGQSGGELEVNALELAPLARLTEYLPFPRQARARLAATEPRGSLDELKMAWTGEAENPQRYSVRGVFSKLAARANEGIPGFAGLTGRLEASERGGSVVLGSRQVAIELPGILAESPARFDRLNAQISWKLSPGEFRLGFNNLSLANPYIAGTLSGSFSGRQGSPGVIDLTGGFGRVDGRTVYRYIPRLPGRVVEYLKAAIRAGQSSDVRLRL